MTEADKLKLEETHILIDSIHWPEVIYAISKDSKSMVVFYGEGHKQELPLWGRPSESLCNRVIRGMGAYKVKGDMRYTESDKDQIEAILYYQYRIDKAIQELLQRHTVKAIRAKVKYMREKREKVWT